MLRHSVRHYNSRPDRYNPVKCILRKALKQIKPTNTPSECVVEEICLPQNPQIKKKIEKSRDFRKTSKSRERKIIKTRKNQKVNFARKSRLFFLVGEKNIQIL